MIELDIIGNARSQTVTLATTRAHAKRSNMKSNLSVQHDDVILSFGAHNANELDPLIQHATRYEGRHLKDVL